MSAYCDLSGLYPPAADEMFNTSIAWQPIPVHTRPTYEDRVCIRDTYNRPISSVGRA